MAPLLIVLEGPDGSGKTTLANAIREQAGKRNMTVHYEHCGYTKFKDKINAYHLAAFWRGLKSGAQVFILDRWWMSEEIYSQVYRGGTPWPQSGRFLDRVFQRFAGLYVIAAPTDTRVAYERAKGRKDDELYWEKNEHICELYHDLLGYSYKLRSYPRYRKEDYGSVFKRSEDVLHYDRDEHTPEDYAAIALDIAKDLYDRRTQKSINPVLDPSFFNLAGNLDAEVVLVGDRTNSKLRNKRLSWPFFEHAHSSLHLAKALQLANIGEDKLMWFNAWNKGADYSLFFARSRRCRFIALGGQAADWLEAHEVDSYHRVPHPQYARRFQHRDLQGYADVLAQAITGQGKSF